MGQLLLIFCVILSIGGGWGAVWQFGKDRKDSVLVSTNSGHISFFHKTTRVQFPVPPCHKVVYVKVEVENELTTPDVRFVKDINTVVIHYKFLQSSLSKYYLLAKAVKQKNCGQQHNKKKSKKRRQHSVDSEDQRNNNKRK